MDSPMCLIDNNDGKLSVVPEAISYLREIKQHVVVVSVIGLYRTGKSYLMNKLAGKTEGFALGSTIQSKTKGIWMWCVTHPRKADHTLVLLDTEGLGDVEKGDAKNDAWIFSLAILLSSTLVYNSRGTIDNQAVENLQYVTELTDRIKVNSSSKDDEEDGADSQFVQFFPNFVWAVRDFFLELKINGKDVTADGYLENSLELKKGHNKNALTYNLPRECLRNYFPSRKCFVFPTPTSPQNLSRLESMKEGDLCENFRDITEKFCCHIFENSPVKTTKGGHKVSGRMLGHLAETYVETIAQGGIPCLENAVLTMAKIENESAIEEGLNVYLKGMENLETMFPVDIGLMSEHHFSSNQNATNAFMQRSFKDENGDFLNILATRIAKLYAECLIKNEEASENKCSDLLGGLYSPVAKMMEDGLFTKPGGYELYCTQYNDLVTQYRLTPNKGVRAEEVLQKFMVEKKVQSKAILQADKMLTEKEKKIHEEKRRSEVLEQEGKAAEQKQMELQLAMEADQKIQKDSLKKLEEKWKTEQEEQRQEFERAMEYKLQEQKDLIDKGHEEKAELLQQEIDELKNKTPEKERNALAMQEQQALKEAHQQLERVMEERQRSHNEIVRQFQEKRDQETDELRKEAERAMECKVQELQRLQERNFSEKERLMKEEIEHLKKSMVMARKMEEEEKSHDHASMQRNMMQSVSDGLGHYFFYKQKRDKYNALKYVAKKNAQFNNPGTQV